MNISVYRESYPPKNTEILSRYKITEYRWKFTNTIILPVVPRTPLKTLWGQKWKVFTIHSKNSNCSNISSKKILISRKFIKGQITSSFIPATVLKRYKYISIKLFVKNYTKQFSGQKMDQEHQDQMT